MKIWIYYSSFHNHAWAMPNEIQRPDYQQADLIGVWDYDGDGDIPTGLELRSWISYRIKILGFPKPPFLNIDYEAIL